MRSYEIIDIDNFIKVATEIMNNNVFYEIKPGKYLFYQDIHGRIYVMIPPMSLAIIQDECGNINYYEGNTNSVIFD